MRAAEPSPGLADRGFVHMTHRLRRLLPLVALTALALVLPASASADLSFGNFECCSTSGEAHSPSTATLSAAFMGQGTPTTVHFEYKAKGAADCNDGYQFNHPGAYSFPGATKTPDQQIPGQGERGDPAAFFSAEIGGLTGGTTYCVTYF